MARTPSRSPKRIYQKPMFKLGLGLFILALLLTGAYYGLIRNPKPATSSSDSSALQQKKALADAGAQTKKNLVESGGSSQNSHPASGPAANSSDPSTILDLTARQETNGTVTVFTKLNPSTSGSCNLTITNGVKSDVQTANIIYQPEFSTCAGFSVPISQLGAGAWNIQLSVGTSVKSISLEVK